MLAIGVSRYTGMKALEGLMHTAAVLRRVLCAVSCLLGFALSGSVSAVSLSDYYTRTGQSETLAAPLSTFGGVTTFEQWSGRVELLVSGVGYNFPAVGGYTDAFYYYVPGSPDIDMPERDNQNWGLRMSFTGCAAGLECGAPSILDFIVFAEGLGPVTPLVNYLPGDPGGREVVPYRADHQYHFVIDVGPTAHYLTLGYGDGGVSDNGGQFNLQMFAVTPIPEPHAYAMFLTGLSMLGFVLRRRNKVLTPTLRSPA